MSTEIARFKQDDPAARAGHMTTVLRAAPWLVLLLVPPATRGGDWPQIRGPARTGVAAADEWLADAWPAAGPRAVPSV